MALKKYRKNSEFSIVSICGKCGEKKVITFDDLVLSVLPWPFHKDLPACSCGDSVTVSWSELKRSIWLYPTKKDD